MTTEGEDGQSPWQRLLEIKAHVPRFSYRQQAGFHFDSATETWVLELRNAIYTLYPEWAMEHPGDTMGIGRYGGGGPSSYAVTNEDLAACSSPFVRFTAVERNEAGEVTVFDAECAGLLHLRFVREDRPK